MHPLNQQKGALLFEMFVALLILSIGITGSLRIFSEALYAGKGNRERTAVREGLARWQFEWNVIPGARMVEEKTVPFHYIDEKDGTLYTYEFKPEPLQKLLPETEQAVKPEGDSEKQIVLRGGRVYHSLSIDVSSDVKSQLGEYRTVIFSGAYQ